MGPHQAVVVEAILHNGPARLVELLERVGKPHGAVATHDERQCVRILGAKDRGKRSAVRLGPKLLQLVEAHQGSMPEFAASFLEDRGCRADVRPIDEHRVPIAAEKRFGGSRPFGLGDLDQLAEHTRRHSLLPKPEA